MTGFLLVVEYCCHGNLNSYLLTKRLNYINHVDSYGQYLKPEQCAIVEQQDSNA